MGPEAYAHPSTPTERENIFFFEMTYKQEYELFCAESIILA